MPRGGRARTKSTPEGSSCPHPGDRPIPVGSHHHFAGTNPALAFDRAAAARYAERHPPPAPQRASSPACPPPRCAWHPPPGCVPCGGAGRGPGKLVSTAMNRVGPPRPGGEKSPAPRQGEHHAVRLRATGRGEFANLRGARRQPKSSSTTGGRAHREWIHAGYTAMSRTSAGPDSYRGG